MEISPGQGLTASQVWLASPKRLTIGGANVPSGSLQQSYNLGAQSLTAAGNFNRTNLVGTPGVFLVAGFTVSVALAGGVATVQMEISADANPAYVFPIYSGGIIWDVAGQALAHSVVGVGSAVGNSISWPVAVQFSNTLSVNVNILASTLTTGQIIVAQTIYTHA